MPSHTTPGTSRSITTPYNRTLPPTGRPHLERVRAVVDVDRVPAVPDRIGRRRDDHRLAVVDRHLHVAALRLAPCTRARCARPCARSRVESLVRNRVSRAARRPHRRAAEPVAPVGLALVDDVAARPVLAAAELDALVHVARVRLRQQMEAVAGVAEARLHLGRERAEVMWSAATTESPQCTTRVIAPA